MESRAKPGPIPGLKFQQMATQEEKVKKYFANCIEVDGNLWFMRYFPKKVASDFLSLCHHLLEFQNEACSNLDQLNCGCVAFATYPLVPLYLAFEYLHLMQEYTFFWWRL